MTSLNSKLQLALLNRKKGRNLLEKGFTLVELMIVVVIVGILSAVALPSFLSQQDKARATEATQNISSILKAAYADYQADLDEADADKAAKAAIVIANSNGENFGYDSDTANYNVDATDDKISLIARGKTGTSMDKKDLGGCVNLKTGQIEIDKSIVDSSSTAYAIADVSCP
jgi:type IV pilus assembly protein PilA